MMSMHSINAENLRAARQYCYLGSKGRIVKAFGSNFYWFLKELKFLSELNFFYSAECFPNSAFERAFYWVAAIALL